LETAKSHYTEQRKRTTMKLHVHDFDTVGERHGKKKVRGKGLAVTCNSGLAAETAKNEMRAGEGIEAEKSSRHCDSGKGGTRSD